ncbi:unnamed protein product [Darwinula stevensoni]|uniref:Uncharacterized protein n=1 Tax=Darwinula stevensoni TaxID=69355 RepID=A0A7R9AF17_9CRUS|nr:unnamed protein product [Darwinula stevensoni]CAG0902172.1 unnamed protein product [Darwinula stevensoni]
MHAQKREKPPKPQRENPIYEEIENDEEKGNAPLRMSNVNSNFREDSYLQCFTLIVGGKRWTIRANPVYFKEFHFDPRPRPIVLINTQYLYSVGIETSNFRSLTFSEKDKYFTLPPPHPNLTLLSRPHVKEKVQKSPYLVPEKTFHVLRSVPGSNLGSPVKTCYGEVHYLQPLDSLVTDSLLELTSAQGVYSEPEKVPETELVVPEEVLAEFYQNLTRENPLIQSSWNKEQQAPVLREWYDRVILTLRRLGSSLGEDRLSLVRGNSAMASSGSSGGGISSNRYSFTSLGVGHAYQRMEDGSVTSQDRGVFNALKDVYQSETSTSSGSWSVLSLPYVLEGEGGVGGMSNAADELWEKYYGHTESKSEWPNPFTIPTAFYPKYPAPPRSATPKPGWNGTPDFTLDAPLQEKEVNKNWRCFRRFLIFLFAVAAFLALVVAISLYYTRGKHVFGPI